LGEENTYDADSEALKKGIQLFNQGNLTEAIAALEAAVRQNPKNPLAWTKLGIAQAENDQDSLAIKALKKGIETATLGGAGLAGHAGGGTTASTAGTGEAGTGAAPDATGVLLEAYLSLAVSYTNEFLPKNTVEALWNWLVNNPNYNQFMKTNSISLVENDPDENQRRMESLLISVAKQAPPNQLDPNIHAALGLLYNLTFEYDKAIACFKAALTQRPEDYQLWNKLGATTANCPQGRERADEAIDAYFRALSKKPSYTRARSNLGISYMAIGDYAEAAKCFLGALTINNSYHLWDNLRTALNSLGRHDLVVLCMKKDPELFRKFFDF